MQKWFFMEDAENVLIRRRKGDETLTSDIIEEMETIPPAKPWLFRTRAPDLKPGEVLCVTGSVPELGNWYPEKAIVLEREGNSDVWSSTVLIQDKQLVRYRYLTCVIVDSGIQVIVRNWETHLNPRVIQSDGVSPGKDDPPESYGACEDSYCIDRGWCTKETMVQLKLIKNPLSLWRPRYANRTVYIKVTPTNLIRHNTAIPRTMAEALEESLSLENQDVMENVKHDNTQVACLTAADSFFHEQGQFGKEYNDGDILVFQSTVLFPSTCAFLIDLYVYSSRAKEGDPPYHAGFSYLLPSVLQSSDGSCILPVTSTKHRPLGKL